MATINSLGIGSGVLTSDLVEQLREADENVIIKPLEDKLTLANQKEEAYDLLSSLMTTFKSSASALSGENLYLGRSVNGSTDAITVKAESGSDVQSFNITEIDKAEADVWNSTSLSEKSTPITDLGAGTLTISINGEDFTIEYTAESSLNDIRDSINDAAGTTMTASVLEIGADSYELIITANDVNQAITFSDSSTPVKQLDTITLSGDAVAGDTFTWSDGINPPLAVNLVDGETPDETGARIAAAINSDPTLSGLYTATAISGGFTIESIVAGTAFTGTATSTGTQTSEELVTTANVVGDDAHSLATVLNLNNIQPAEAATFKYNGIDITRSSNEISDLINGVTLTLNQNQSVDDSANIVISQNNTSINSEMSLFVNSYNSLATNLQDMTRSDRETGSVGIFNGESFIKSISRDLTNLITQVNNGNSLIDYGISIDRDGVMSLDNSVFNEKFTSDPEAMELFFSGNDTTDGIFTKLNDKMTGYTGYGKLMSNFSEQLDASRTSLTEQYDKQKATLDSRYEILTKKFIAYDAMISRLNSQFSSMQMMIDAEYASKE